VLIGGTEAGRPIELLEPAVDSGRHGMRAGSTFSWAIGFALSIASLAVLAAKPTAQAATSCKQPPVEACATKHGRFSTQNGIAQTIWLVGTTRRLSVDNAATDFLPAAAMKYTEMTSPDHSYIFGDFTICPIEADAPGHIRAVCVTAAKNLVVQNTDGSHPAFRLLETWTAPR